MNQIPPKLRAEMAEDPFYKVCCITGKTAKEAGEKLEWHHNLIFANRQVQEKFCILPILKSIHAKANNRNMREKLNYIMLNRATDEQLRKYSKAINWVRERDRLNKLYVRYAV